MFIKFIYFFCLILLFLAVFDWTEVKILKLLVSDTVIVNLSSYFTTHTVHSAFLSLDRHQNNGGKPRLCCRRR